MIRNDYPSRRSEGMFIKKVLIDVIIFILICFAFTQCNAQRNNYQTSSRGLKTEASLIRDSSSEQINVKNVRKSENYRSKDKKQNNREFPPSARKKRDFDDELLAPIVEGKTSPECILLRSEFYLSWWVFENGSLKLPPSNRSGSSLGFADLSLNFHSETAIFKHLADMTTENPDDVR